MGHVCRLAKGALFLVLLSICACGDSVSEAPTGTEVAATESTTSITPVDFPNSSFSNSSSSLWAPQSSSSSQAQQGFSSPQMQPTSSSLWNSQTSSSSVENIPLPNNGIPYVRITAADSIKRANGLAQELAHGLLLVADRVGALDAERGNSGSCRQTKHNFLHCLFPCFPPGFALGRRG